MSVTYTEGVLKLVILTNSGDIALTRDHFEFLTKSIFRVPSLSLSFSWLLHQLLHGILVTPWRLIKP